MKKIFAFLLVSIASACAFAGGVKMIFDTDMGNDVDDALALVMLNSYMASGDVELLAIAINKDNPYAPVYVDLVNEFYGNGGVPIFMVDKSGVTPKDGSFNKQVSELKNRYGAYKYARKIDKDSKLMNPTEGIREILARAKDGEVVYVSVGFSSNIERLMKSKGDENSPLSGAELVNKKVKYFSVMAGDFKSTKPEYNVRCDVSSFKYFIENCKTPIVFSGFEIGIAIRYSHDDIDRDFAWSKGGNPVAEAYNFYAVYENTKRKISGNRHDRPTWDLTSVLFVTEPDFFRLSESGTVKLLDDKGSVSFEEGKNGLHRYILLPSESEVNSIKKRFSELCSFEPKK